MSLAVRLSPEDLSALKPLPRTQAAANATADKRQTTICTAKHIMEERVEGESRQLVRLKEV